MSKNGSTPKRGSSPGGKPHPAAKRRGAPHPAAKRRGAVVDFLERENYFSLERGAQRALLEKVIDLVLGGTPPGEDTLDLYGAMIREIEEFSTGQMKAVVFGGGTGLSTILGGDSTDPAWSHDPFAGLKEHFADLTVVVCATDDGGSSGELVRRLPIIALGDLRRAVVSAVTRRGLKRVYRGLEQDRIDALPRIIQKLMNHRFSGRGPRSVSNLLSSSERGLLPEPLGAYLEESWTFLRSHEELGKLSPKGHCLGNLLLLSQIYQCARPARSTAGKAAPGHRHVLNGIARFARVMGAGRTRIFPVSTNQGELKFLYTNGVVVSGEHKSSVSRRGFPVDRVWAEYVGGPRVDARLVKSIAEADIVIVAPGSIYSSLLPILQVPEVAEALRRNRRALKILGANFWVQQGETDLSIRDLAKEFFVSDLIEAYDKNVSGSTAGLFSLVLSTNLKNLPAGVIQSYALEGKVPIYLDKDRVEALGFEPLAAEIHSHERLEKGKVFQHDPARFSRTVHTLVFMKKALGRLVPAGAPRGRSAARSAPRRARDWPPAPDRARSLHMCDYMEEVEALLAAMTIRSKKLLRLLPDIFWNNRDILLDHLKYLRGIRVVPRDRWLRSTVWDRILAYFDPDDSTLHCRSDLLEGDRDRLREDLLIGLGESLLGNYALRKSLRPLRQKSETIGKIFEITLRPRDELRAFLSLDKIKEYLELSRMRAADGRPDVYRLVINSDDSFTPPGLNFGLFYSWYLNNSFGGVIEYETSLLKIATSDLIPKLTMDQERQRKLIDFFRRDIFRH